MKWNSGDIVDGRYKIDRMIGSGGMAEVYRAVDMKARRLVAIKMLKQEFAQNAEFVRRFRSEAEAVMQLNHENIVKSFDISQNGDEQYIVLEYIEGQTLKQMIRSEGPLPPSKAIQLAVQICDALAHAHERMLIHRDVKPQNIIITPKGKAEVTDFGIARFVDASTVTYSGTNILGSVHYVSPEQAKGEQVDICSDLYSIGIVLYEMLTGKLPFDSDNTVSIAIMHIQEPIAPPIDLESGIGRALNDIVMKATQKDKSMRYQNAREMKRDLQRALREPEGQFVNIEKSGAENKKRRGFGYARTRLGGVMNIAIATVILLGLLLSMVLIFRTVFSNSGEKKILVPQLVGKTELEALERCEALGLKLVISDRTSMDDVAEGLIYRQAPDSGVEVKKGDSVQVGISEGPAEITAPPLVGLQWDEAQSELRALGIECNIYRELSDGPEGSVVKQLPEEGTLLQPGDMMDIWVIGEVGDDEIVPSLINVGLEDAVQQLKTSGFERVLVNYVEDAEGVSGVVKSQVPTGGDRVLRNTTIKLWVVKPQNTSFMSQDALNVTVEVQDSKVLVTAKEGIVETTLYEGKLPAGKQVIPVTYESDKPGFVTLIVYINGSIVREKEVELLAKNAE